MTPAGGRVIVREWPGFRGAPSPPAGCPPGAPPTSASRRSHPPLLLLEHVRLVRKAVHGQTARAQTFVPAKARQVPRLARDVHDIALLGLELGQPLDVVADRAEHDQPKFAT